ncbi:MAG: hypothetical protein JST16_13845 [Bdellovibrionales bacterium]|nr:hypothetical protein [Bdellovibrionales bacterium]
MSPEELLKRTAAGKVPALLILKGQDPYLSREWKKLLRKAGFDLEEKELKKSGPDASAQDAAAGMSLFQTRQILWMRAVSPPSAWSKEALYAWKHLQAQADGDTLCVVLQVDTDKRLKWDSLGIKDVVEWQVDPSALGPWLKRMNESRGSFLKAEQQSFLLSLEADLLQLDNWVELWSCGGDLWAERSLGWGTRPAGGAMTNTNPVFAWVDAVLAGKRRDSVRLLRKILDQGEEPLQLMALLSKSVRILASVSQGRPVRGQPDFLVQKLQRLKSSLPAGHAQRLLKRSAEVDRLMKSSPVKASALLLRL